MPLDRRHRTRTGRALVLCLAALVFSLASLHTLAQENNSTSASEEHGRKYKAPPDTSQVEVTVLKDFNQKPIMNAAVVFNPVKDGVDEGNLEVKTDPDGKAKIDVIPTGSNVTIQVIADGFATFAQEYRVDGPSRKIVIKMLRPRAQVSAYIDNNGKPAQMPPGIQVPIRPKSATTTPSAGAAGATGAPASATAPATPPATGPPPVSAAAPQQ